MAPRLRPTFQEVEGRLGTAVEGVILWSMADIAFKLGWNEESNSCSPGSIDEIQLLGVGNGRDQEVDALKGVTELLDVSKINNCDLAAREVFLKLRMGLRVRIVRGNFQRQIMEIYLRSGSGRALHLHFD